MLRHIVGKLYGDKMYEPTDQKDTSNGYVVQNFAEIST